MRDIVALAHERRVPVLIHAGRGIPALGQDTVRPVGRVHRRAADPRPRRDLRPRVAVARAARAPEPVRRHRVVGPGRHDRHVHALPARQPAVGERLAVRAAAGLGRAAPALRAPGRASAPRRCARSPARSSSGCSTAASRSTPGRRRARRAPLDPLLERVVSHLNQAIARIVRPRRPGGAGRARAARLRGRRGRPARRRASRAVLGLLDLYEEGLATRRRPAAASRGAAPAGRGDLDRAHARRAAARTCRRADAADRCLDVREAAGRTGRRSAAPRAPTITSAMPSGTRITGSKPSSERIRSNETR